MKTQQPKITWTKIDEAPALASHSFLPVVEAFTATAGVDVETRDISLAGRIIANFPEVLTDEQKINDELAFLGKLVKEEDANIIKLPNISASIPQLKAAISELQKKGYNLPDFPEEPKTEEEKELRKRYAVCLGSAVNPVLREGNSDRRVAPSVKAYAQKNPKKLSAWDKDSKAHVAHMQGGDFFANEKSIIMDKDDVVRYEFVDQQGNVTVLKDNMKLIKGEMLDGTFMSAKELRKFIAEQIEDAKKNDTLFSVHLKATMMKVSDPVIFGHFVSVFFKDVFEKYADTFKKLGVNPELGLGDLYKKIETLPADEKKAIEDDIKAVYDKNPDLAMVNSDKGITNLHAGNDIIIDASMPVVIRDGGKMWNKDGELQETKAIIPDRSYAKAYQVVVDFCKKNGALDPATMGNVSNVGLMAQKAEEYGSHDKTFVAPADGVIRVVNSEGETIMEHNVGEGDIYRGCQTKDIPVQDWVKLAVNRAKNTGYPTIFWLNPERAHDALMKERVETYLKDHDTEGLDIRIMTPVDAMQFSLEQVKAGKNAISVTGNVLRDYLTDLFPILELGTSAKMLSIVPLIAGGGLFETGAGGSAPKHVQQFQEEGHLRWDSLGEFLALTVSLEHLADKYNNDKAKVLSDALDKAVSQYLENQKSPSRKAGELDNRGSHFFLTQYWADELAKQTEDKELSEKFAPIAEQLKSNEEKILQEIADAEGKPKDIGGYYKPNDELASKAMRPSATFNEIIANI
ncbi:isocitrate dehydrogenase [Balneicella halophila]|uniref:Isocitrate dehydrogenase [NADP] n=1 Tax=Balneicella halophila TaxID=1537566 RepID=A0A7L4UQG5_BALHA|nr:NADP-dependent isocitrate dehydrogenase [Balneicella halophila]PVX51752.1 isocitrate dehydrogenase [Balneicella halophila]